MVGAPLETQGAAVLTGCPGDTGMGTLCNACGLKFIHMHHRDKKNARRRELYMLQKVAKPRQPSS